MAKEDILIHSSDVKTQYNHYCCNPKCRHHKSVPRSTYGYWMKNGKPSYFTLAWFEEASFKSHSLVSVEDGQPKIYGEPVSVRHFFTLKVMGVEIHDTLCDTCYQVYSELLCAPTLVPAPHRGCSNPLCGWHGYSVAPQTTTITYSKFFKAQMLWPSGGKYLPQSDQYYLQRYALHYPNSQKEGICLCETCFEVGVLLGEFQPSGSSFTHPNVQIVK